MAGNSFGTLFKITTFGESHGPALGVVIDGCPAGLKLDLENIRRELARRRPGQSKLVTQRQETEEFEILSGVFEEFTTGTPLTVVVRNVDAKSKDYDEIKDLFRPGHADFTYFAKYGVRDHRGGGRSSARETVGRVIAGAIAKQLLATAGIEIRGGVLQIGKVRGVHYDWAQVEQNELRALDPKVLPAMLAELDAARKERDSVGAIVEVQALNVSAGLGEPVFDKLDAVLASALMSIPAVKGVEIGSGFASAAARGSENNDPMLPEGFLKNDHGGILGGISSGAPIVARIALKPTSSLPQEQLTINTGFAAEKIVTKGRHDPCVGIRAVPIAEAMLALVLADFWLQQLASVKAREGFSELPQIEYGLARK